MRCYSSLQQRPPLAWEWKLVLDRTGWQKIDHIRSRRQVDAAPIRQTLSETKTLDAGAIAEAVTRPTMRLVPAKRHEQLDMQALHRVHAQFVHQRTALVSQVHCFLLEYGIAIHADIGMFRRDATRILSDDSNDLTPTMRQLPTDLWLGFLRIYERVSHFPVRSKRPPSTTMSYSASRRFLELARLGKARCARPLEMASSSTADATWLRGSASFRVSIRPRRANTLGRQQTRQVQLQMSCA